MSDGSRPAIRSQSSGDRVSSRGPGFSVLYRWRIRPGSEAAFIDAWTEVSLDLKRKEVVMKDDLARDQLAKETESAVDYGKV